MTEAAQEDLTGGPDALDEMLERLLRASRNVIDALQPVGTLPIIVDALRPFRKLVIEIEVATNRSGAECAYWTRRQSKND